MTIVRPFDKTYKEYTRYLSSVLRENKIPETDTQAFIRVIRAVTSNPTSKI